MLNDIYQSTQEKMESTLEAMKSKISDHPHRKSLYLYRRSSQNRLLRYANAPLSSSICHRQRCLDDCHFSLGETTHQRYIKSYPRSQYRRYTKRR